MLSTEFGIAINWMVTAPHHGKNLVDALAGRDKYDLSNGLIKGLDCLMVDADGNKISEAEKCCRYLNDQRRTGKLVGDTKHKHHEGSTHITSRAYGVTNFTKDNPIPLEGTSYKVESGFHKGKKTHGDHTKNGIHEMYNFFFHPGMPHLTAAIRRIPCLCKGCYDQLSKPWVYSDTLENHPEDQEKFDEPSNCVFEPMMADLNKWHFVKVGVSKEVCDLEEVCAVYEDPQEAMDGIAEASIKYGTVGVINSAVTEEDTDGYRLVEWFGTPYPLQAPAMVEGCEGDMPVGTVVVQAKYLKKIPKAPRWHEFHRSENPAKLIWMRNILETDLTLMGYKKGSHAPPKTANKKYEERTAQTNVKKVTKDDHQRFQLERKARAALKAQELTIVTPPERRQKKTDAQTKKRKAEMDLVAGMLD
jgi:hypothetical protein